ncbi:hypothetical protein [uncultured Croceitalea sp.]|uniref:hypothetical protein n=1 Tax=uncultured Croceitalea sp. TaxID=1798908 RepID=UPI0033061107
MNCTYQSIKKQLWPILVLFFLCCQAKAQENLRYKGELTVGKYQGNADYGYKIIDGDTLLNGSFRLKKANLDSLLKKQDYSFDFSGSFFNNFPNGAWSFRFGEFQSNNKSQVIDYQYRVAVSGVQEEARGLILKGKPDGNWTFEVSKIEDSKVAQTLFKSNITFDNGIPQKNFIIENDSITLAGRFLRNGLAHDEWSLYESFGLSASENWLFSNGVLNQIETELDGVVTITPIYGKYSGDTKILNLDKKYIQAIALYQLINDDAGVKAGGEMQRLLEENAAYYKKIDAILSELGESSFLPEFKVKVPYFPLTDDENQLLNRIKTNYKTSEEISTSFLEDTQLNILKLSDQDAAFNYEVIKKITKDFLNPVSKLLAYQNQEIVEFAPRNQLISGLWTSEKPSTTIEVNVVMDSTKTLQTFSLDSKEEFDFTHTNLESLVQLSEYALQSLTLIENKLKAKLTNSKRKQELISKEEELIAQQKTLQSLIDSVIVDSPSTIRTVLKKLRKHSEESLVSYALLTDLEPKLLKAQKLLVCYQQLEVLAKNIAKLPEQEEAIKERYKDRVWNPFMATLMDEEVKKRIVTAYKRVLVPYFLEQVKEDFRCRKTADLNILMNNTQQRMLELRTKNTSKLERKLRKINDPLTVFELLGIQPSSKEQ